MTSLPIADYDIDDVEAISRVLTGKQILSKNMNWSNLNAAGILQQEELRLINLYDGQRVERKVSDFREKPHAYAKLFYDLIGGASGVANVERTQYGLALMEEILDEEKDSFKYFLALKDPFAPFLRILQTQTDTFCASKAAKIVSLFLFRSKQIPENVLDEVMQWCNDQLRKPETADAALDGLQNLLRHNDIRVKFFHDDGLNRLGSLLKQKSIETQTTYKALYCLWLLSYNDDIAAQFHTTNVIKFIVESLKKIPKEKIIRIGSAVLANIANKGENNMNNQQMIGAKIARVLDNTNQRKWADTDIISDLEFLTTTITDNISEMSSWEAYKTEVSSGVLERSVVHKSDRFWKENINMFEKDEAQVLGMLIHILKESQNPQNLEIACHDVGQFIRYHPMGRRIIDQMDAKHIIMSLMEHADPAVQKEALLTTQKLLVVSWEHLGGK